MVPLLLSLIGEEQGEEQEQGPKNISRPKANLKLKTICIVGQFQAHKPFNFVSLTDSFILSFSELLNL